MKSIQRAFDSESGDFKKLCQFVIQHYQQHQENFTWLIGRLIDWKYGLWQEEKYFPNFYPKNAQLWENSFGDLLGFVISESGNSQFSVFLDPNYPFLYQNMVDWVRNNWSDRDGNLETSLTESEKLQQNVLETLGFINNGLSEITYQYDLSTFDFSNIKLPPGFKIEDMKSNYDPAGKAAMQLNAFRDQHQVNKIDLLTRDYVHQSPIYSPEFDLSVVTLTGQHVAGCEAFVDYKNGVAEVERVCTHQDYRRQGLSRMVILSCFKRLYECGIKTAYISGWNEATYRLYGGIQHTKETHRFGYELKK